jgi:hypothetical protein
MNQTINTKPGQLIRAFNVKIEKHDYIRSMSVSNNEKLIYVAFNWNTDIRVFNLQHCIEEGIPNKPL